MTRGQLKKNTPNDGGKSRRKGGGNDANRDEENSGTPLAGAYTVDDDNTKKTTSTSTSANTAGAHISDSEECDPPTSSRSVKQLLASHAADNPFWGGQDHTDEFSVDTEDSAQNLVGFHAYDQQDCEEDKEILAIEEEREEARLMALDQQRLDALLGSDTPNDGSEDLDEETARLIAVEWINTAEPDDKSDLLQNMHDLDVAVLITSNMDCDFKGKIPQEPDFQIGQHRN